jgi:chromosome segregation ATPase
MKTFDMEEFIEDSGEGAVPPEPKETETEEAAEETAPELDVQKAVVEELAAEKVKIENDLATLKGWLEKRENEVATLRQQLTEKTAELAKANEELSKMVDKELDMQERNPNALALLDRDVEIPDRFPGETRDHVLEVIKEARDKAEEEGRLRRAQVLEAVLVANEANGTLANRRANLEKLFAQNGNLVSGQVMSELDRLGISYKDGENYLMPSEILKRSY